MLAFFNMDGKLDFSIELLKSDTRTLANISAFSFMIFVGISVSWQALKVSNFKMSLGFRVYVFLNFGKEKRKSAVFIVDFSYSKHVGMAPIFYYTF